MNTKLYDHFRFYPDEPLNPITKGNLEYTPLEKPKYEITISGTHALITIYQKEHLKPKLFFFKLPIKHVLHVNPKILKILWKHSLITQRQVELVYKQWSEEESYIIMEKTDWRGLLKETITIPVKRRGNQHYHRHTWSRLQWYQLIFDSYPLIYTKTNHKKPHKINQTCNRTIHKCNTIMITLTYPQDNTIPKTWERTTGDINRYLTNLRNRLKRRDNKILFYIKANESHVSNYPHIHILMKTKQPYDFYSIRRGKGKPGTKLKPFKDTKDLFKWKYGYYDLTGINDKKMFNYITKYITKITNTQEKYATQNKTLSNTWISNKRLFSNSVVCLFKQKFPSLHKFMKLTEKFTVNKAVDKYWDGFKFPTIDWEWCVADKPPAKRRFKFLERRKADIVSTITLKEPLPTRLNKEGFYQVIALRFLRNKKTVLVPLYVHSDKHPDPKDRNNPHKNVRLKH